MAVWAPRKKCKGELQEAKHNILIGKDGKEQELCYSIQEILVLDKQRCNVCLRKWCGEDFLEAGEKAKNEWEG